MISNLNGITNTNIYVQPAKTKVNAGISASYYNNNTVTRPSFTSYNPVIVVKTTL